MGLFSYILTGLLAVVVYFSYDFYKSLTMNSIFDKHDVSDFSSCSRVTEIKGCEDFVIHYPSGYAFAGCPENYLTHVNWFIPKEPVNGENSKYNSYFISYDMDKKKAKKLATKGLPPQISFDILGVDLVENPEDKNLIHLLAVNRSEDGKDSVIHFTHSLKSSEIKYIETFESECLRFINSIAALTPNTFYYTQLFTNSKSTFQVLEKVGMLEGGKVMFYDGKNCHELAKGFKIPNGIDFSPDRSLVYVAETFRGKLHVFKRDNVDLKPINTVSLEFLPDNAHVDPQSGHIYVAGFSPGLKEALKLTQYNGVNVTEPAKSIVARVVTVPGPEQEANPSYKVEPLLIDHGDTMFSTTAVAGDASRNALLSSGLYTSKGMLDCRFQLGKETKNT